MQASEADRLREQVQGMTDGALWKLICWLWAEMVLRWEAQDG